MGMFTKSGMRGAGLKAAVSAPSIASGVKSLAKTGLERAKFSFTGLVTRFKNGNAQIRMTNMKKL